MIDGFDADGEAIVDDYASADPLTASGLPDLDAGASLVNVEVSLRRLGACLNGTDQIGRQLLREAVIQELRRIGVTRPAQLADTVLGQSKRGADEEVKGQGSVLRLEDPEPWPDPVDGARLLSELARIFENYLVLAEGAADVLALWTAHTYVIECFDHTAYLALTSPTPRCGKTTALTIVKAVARRALSADNVSAAAIYRVVQEARPTLLVDELDRVPPDSDIWGILNSGHGRGGAVLRVVGENLEPRAFATYCPKVIAYIRPARSPVPATVEDRSIRITLQRKRRSEPRAKVRSRELEAETLPFRRQLMRWAEDHGDVLADARPQVPDELDDRAFDCWEGLLAVAEEAGGRWSEAGRVLAARFSAERGEEEAENPGVLLLADLGALLESGRLQLDPLGLSGDAAVSALRELPERPWRTWGRSGDGLSAHALARLLRPFAVRPELVGPERARVRRYPDATLRSAIERMTPFTPEHSGSKCSSAQPPKTGHVSASTASAEHMSTSEVLTGEGEGKRKRSALDNDAATQLEPDAVDREVL